MVMMLSETSRTSTVPLPEPPPVPLPPEITSNMTTWVAGMPFAALEICISTKVPFMIRVAVSVPQFMAMVLSTMLTVPDEKTFEAP